MPGGFPDYLIPAISTPAAQELLGIVEGCPCSRELRAYFDALRGDVERAVDQAPLFPGGEKP